MECQVKIDSKGKVTEVFAQNGKKSNAFESLTDIVSRLEDKTGIQNQLKNFVGTHINNLTDTKELALGLYKQLYSPMFKDWFGDWNKIAEAMTHRDDVKGYYKFSFDQDPQKFLYEIASQANSSPSEKSGAIEVTNEDIVRIAQEIFPNAKGSTAESVSTYSPVIGDVDINGEPILINDTYSNANGDQRNVLQQSVNSQPSSSLYQLTGSSAETIPSKASRETIATIKEFLERIGVKLESVANIVVDGQKITANGIADPLNRLVQVVGGKEDVALPEEAFHIATEIIAQKDTKLFNQMMNQVSKYQMYDKVFQEYKDTYTTPEGKPDIPKIKKEALAKILAETFIRNNQEVVEKPELLAQNKTWWQKIIDSLKYFFLRTGMNVFKEDPFKMAIGLVNKENTKALTEKDLENLKDSQYLQTRANPDEVQYQFKAATKIFDNIKKVEAWEKQIKNEDQFFKKIQNDLQIPKDQLQLIRDNYNGDIKEAVNSMVAQMAYTVEVKGGTRRINTVYAGRIQDGAPEGMGNFHVETHLSTEEGYEPHDIEFFDTKEEAQAYIDKVNDPEKTKPFKPSNYYERLSVPGGTKYEENDIRTPTIIPITRSHAQFANDNSIGWFRSDELPHTTEYNVRSEPNTPETEGRPLQLGRINLSRDVVNPKTRRVLEVQSDLFQKGRDKASLLDESEESFTAQIIDADYKSGLINLEQRNTQIKQLESINDFLQLLNKDGAWIGFFVKTIMQDSLRKGYENVRFPSGDTASKVEGHSTITDRIANVNRRLEELDKLENSPNKPVYSLRANDNSGWSGEYASLEEAQRGLQANGQFVRDNFHVEERSKEKTDFKARRKELEEEKANLKDNGLAKLAPIVHFYEVRLKNTLDKIYGKNNVVRVTDEHGNDWFEVKTDGQRDRTIYFQKSGGQETLADKLRRINQNLVKTDTGYELNGVKVTSAEQRQSKTDEGRKKTRFEDQGSDQAKADRAFTKSTEGVIKQDLTDIFTRYINDEGNIRDTPMAKIGRSAIDPNDETFYNSLEENIKDRLADKTTYPLGTKFFHDINIYNEGSKVATTVDFIAIKPNGKVEVLQFKAPEIKAGTNDISTFKQAQYNTEMEQIRNILELGYGVKKSNFEKTRTVPIKADYTHVIPGDIRSPLSKISGLKIGNVNVKLVQDDLLLPIPSTSEITGVRKFDDLISKLRGLLKKTQDKYDPSVSSLERGQTIANLYNSIKKLQVQRDTTALISSAKTINIRQRERLNRLDKLVDELDPNTATIAQMSEIANKILEDKDEAEIYAHMDDALHQIFKDGSPESNKILSEAASVAQTARNTSDDLFELSKKLQTQKYAAKVGITDEFTPEKQLTWYRRMVRSLSQSHTTAGKLLWELVDRINGDFHIRFQQRLDKLIELQKGASEWIKSHSVEQFNKKFFMYEKDKWTGKVIKKYDPQFYKDLTDAKESGNAKWVKENIDMKAYDEWFQRVWRERAEQTKTARYSEDDVINEQLKYNKMNEWLDTYSPTRGFANRFNGRLKEFPLDKHFSTEYKELLKPENKAILDVYNHWNERLKESVGSGMIEEHNGWAWFPNVRKNFWEKVQGGDKKGGLKDLFIGNTRIDAEDQEFGKIDPITRKAVNEVHANYVTDLAHQVDSTDGKYWDASAKSQDVFKVMALWDREILKYGLKTESEGLAKMLLFTEQNRKSLRVTTRGKLLRDKETGEVVEDNNNEKNAQYLQDHIENVIYGRTTINESDFAVKIPVKSIAEKINKMAGRKIMDAPEEETLTLSGVKGLSALNRWFALKTLGVNVLSPIANLFGGTFNTYLNQGKYFNKKEFAKAEMDLVSARFYGTEQAKKLAGLLAYLQPYVEDKTSEQTRHMSVSLAVRHFSSDQLMRGMRFSDNVVNQHIAIAFINNAIFRDGKIQNAREVARKELDHETKKYGGNYEQTKEWNKKLEARVEELKNSPEALLNIATIKDDKIQLPGIDLHNTKESPQTVRDFRSIMLETIKDALGNTSREDMSLYKRSVLYQSIAMFKNWIPRMVDVRGQSLRYNAGTDQYEWGRMRMLADGLMNNFTGTISGLFKSLYNNDETLINVAKKSYEKMRENREKEQEDFNITEAEYIDMYVKGLSAQFKELGLAAAFIGILIAARLHSPDLDEDPTLKGGYKWMLRGMDKLQDEVSFFYNPQSFSDMLNGSIFPAVSLLVDAQRFAGAMIAKGFFSITGDDQRAGAQHPGKYLFRMFPVTKELLNYIAIMDTDLAKKWDLRVSSRNGSSR